MDFFASNSIPQHGAPQNSNLFPAMPPIIFYLLPRLYSAIGTVAVAILPRSLVTSSTPCDGPPLYVAEVGSLFAEKDGNLVTGAGTEDSWRAEFGVVERLCGPPLETSLMLKNDVLDKPVSSVVGHEEGEVDGGDDESGHDEDAEIENLSRDNVSEQDGEEDEGSDRDETVEEDDVSEDGAPDQEGEEPRRLEEEALAETDASRGEDERRMYQDELLENDPSFLGSDGISSSSGDQDSLSDFDDEFFSETFGPMFDRIQGGVNTIVTIARRGLFADLITSNVLAHVTTTPEDDPHCPICSRIFREPVRTIPCGHFFCAMCVTRWLEVRGTCPMCRRALIWLGHQWREYSDDGSDEEGSEWESEGDDGSESEDSSDDSGSDSALYSNSAQDGWSEDSFIEDVEVGG